MVPEIPPLPDGPVMIETSPGCFTVRRHTHRDNETIRKSEYGRFLERVADRDAAHYGISKEEWDQAPDHYFGECFKQCYRVTRLRKGSIYEFGAYGVYICEECEYAYPPGCEPEPCNEDDNAED